MSHFLLGTQSLARLSTCHNDLVRVAQSGIVISPFDWTVVCGARGREDQDRWFDAGYSKVRWPDSRHNVGEGAPRELSDAFDLAPWIDGDIPWDDEGAFYALAGHILTAAEFEGVRLIYGGDWDHDGLTEDQTFMDLGHFQRVT